MRFSKIAITKRAVDLTRETKDRNGAVEEVHLTSPEPPLGSFRDALQGFQSYVTDLLLGAVTVEGDEITISTLNLSEDKNGLRGLIVTALVPVPNAYDKPLVLNTPLVREGGDNASDDAFVLSDEVLELIALAEAEATRYVKGERLQGELFSKAETKPSENTKEFNERAAAAESATTRKPRGRAKKQRDFIPGTGTVINPTATEVLSDAGLRNLLLMVDRDVSIDAIVLWTSSERSLAETWARARQKQLAGQFDALTEKEKKTAVPIEPECVAQSANPRLTADAWQAPVPPKIDDVGAQEVQEAAIRG